MFGAGGRPKPKSFKRTMCVEADAGGAESHEADPAAAEEAKKSGKGRAGSGGAKAQ